MQIIYQENLKMKLRNNKMTGIIIDFKKVYKDREINRIKKKFYSKKWNNNTKEK